jgi:hypothetical protein
VADFDEDGGTLSLNGDEYGYVSVDSEADTVTLGSAITTAASANDMVTIVNATGSPVSTWFAEVLLDDPDDADPVDCEIGTALVDKYDEGVYDPSVPVVVTAESGSWEVLTSPGQVLANSSRDYTPGEAGWVLGDDDAQLPNTNVVGSLGADTVSADVFTLAGQDLQVDILNSRTRGVLSQAVLGNSTVDTANVSASTILAVFTATNLLAGRVYKINYGSTVTGTVTGDVFLTRVYFSTDGTTPTTTGGIGIMDGSICPVTIVANQTVLGEHSYYYYPTTDIDTLKLGFALVRSAGTGTAKYTMTNANLPFYAAVEDVGDASTVTGTISQKSKATGTADVDPVGTYTRTYTATASRSYDADNGFRTGAPATHDCYQGYYSGTHGNTKSLVAFDDSAIRAALSGATIKSVKLKFRVKHAYYNAGLNVRIKTHNNSSLPATYSAGGEIASRDSCREGTTYTVNLPVSFGTDLKNGVARGVGFYAPGTNRVYYGYMYGVSTGSSAPQLIVTYTK